jgi:hypothetical protein
MVVNSERRSSRFKVMRNSGSKENLACNETTVIENKLPKAVLKSKRASEIINRLNKEKKVKEAEAFVRSENPRGLKRNNFLPKLEQRKLKHTRSYLK